MTEQLTVGQRIEKIQACLNGGLYLHGTDDVRFLLDQLTAIRRDTWDAAIKVAKGFSDEYGSNAFKIRDRYGSEAVAEEELELIAQGTADMLVTALQAARDEGKA